MTQGVLIFDPTKIKEEDIDKKLANGALDSFKIEKEKTEQLTMDH